jgi:hypothetical protein
MDRFSKTCLLLIVCLLASIAIRPIVAPEAALAAQHKYIAVSAVTDNRQDIQGVLDKYSADGWEFTGAIAPEGQHPILFFQK